MKAAFRSTFENKRWHAHHLVCQAFLEKQVSSIENVSLCSLVFANSVTRLVACSQCLHMPGSLHLGLYLNVRWAEG